MKKKWKITIMTAILSISFLSACNVEKRNTLNNEDEIDFQPIRYQPKINRNESNNEYKNQDNRRFLHDENPTQTDYDMKKGQ